MAVSAQVANKTTLNLILGIFLKLLGFFAVMYTYTEVNPIKAQQAEESIRERFNISVSLMPKTDGQAEKNANAQIMQDAGKSFVQISEALKSQLDFLSSQYYAMDSMLVLKLPAKYIMDLDGKPAKSPEFAKTMTDVLQANGHKKFHYEVEIIAAGQDSYNLMRGISSFVQKMISTGYEQKYLTIGYEQTDEDAIVEFRLKAVQ